MQNNSRMARTVQPPLFLDEALYDAEMQSGVPVRAIYIALHTTADRMGRFSWSPTVFRMLSLDPLDHIDHAMSALQEIGKIVHYQVDGKEYGMIVDFHRTQHVNPRERLSTIPSIEEGKLILQDGKQISGKRSRGRPSLNDPRPEASSFKNVQADSGSRKQVKVAEESVVEADQKPQTTPTLFEMEDEQQLAQKLSVIKRDVRKGPIVVDGYKFVYRQGSVQRLSMDPDQDPDPVIVEGIEDFSPAIAHFECDGPIKRIGVSEKRALVYDEAYPTGDNIMRIKQASMWVKDNPDRKKTAAGIMKFLGTWIMRSHNSGDCMKQGSGVARQRSSVFSRTNTDQRVESAVDDFAAQFEEGGRVIEGAVLSR